MKWKKILLFSVSLFFVFSLCGCEGKVESTEDYVVKVSKGVLQYGISNTLFVSRANKLKKLNLFGEHPLENLDTDDNVCLKFSFRIKTDLSIKTEQIIVSSLPRNKVIILIKEDQKAPTIRFKFRLQEINKVHSEYGSEYGEANPGYYIDSRYIVTATIRISPEDWEKIKNQKDEST